MAYSKNPNDKPISWSPLWAIRFPGAPMRERFPPIAAAKTNGIRSREREYPDLAAIPVTTGIRTAAVPVLERTPLMEPTMIIMAAISVRSPLANRVTMLPIRPAIPVSNSAPPTMNMATKRMTLESMNPAKAVLTSSTPVTTRPQQTIMEVSPSGSFSVTNMRIAKRRNSRVMVDGFIQLHPFLYRINPCVDTYKPIR